MSKVIFSLQDVSKEFGGNYAIKGIDLQLVAGEIHALVGENGAGKSTLCKIIAGVYAPSEGTLHIDGQPVQFRNPTEALDSGIAMVYQETSLVSSMTVAQNLFLGSEKRFYRLRGLYISAQQLLGSLSFNVDPWATVGTLGAAQKQMVEIARAVRQHARVIIFDEPTATLTPEEKHYFFMLLQRLCKEGIAILFISHAIEEALSWATQITVLRDGQLIGNDLAINMTKDSIIKDMVGRELSGEAYQPQQRADQKPVNTTRILSVENLSMGGIVRNTSFSIYTGQITGLFGLVGSGRSETAKVIAGVIKRNHFYGGVVRYQDREVRYRTPGPAVNSGIVYITEDRKADGFFENMTIQQNIEAGLLVKGSTQLGFLGSDYAKEETEKWKKIFQIRAINPAARIVELSGGNQQKVVAAKSLAQAPRLIFFDEPTRGVDVGAISEIHNVIRDLADSGLAVVVISSYLPEILKLSDRVLVYRSGRVVEEFDADEATEEGIMYAAVH